MQRLHCELPNAIIRQIPDCGHLPHVEKPHSVSKLIMEFVQEDSYKEAQCTSQYWRSTPYARFIFFYLCSENIELSGLLYSWFSNFSQIQIKHMLTQSRLDILWKWNYSILHASDLTVPSWCQHAGDGVI